MVETFFDLEELVVAVEAVRGVSSLPIVALLTFDDEAEITGGVGAEVVASRLAALDVAAIGTNHGAGPTVALKALRGMRDAGVPLAALPNIGLASLAGGRVVYPHSTPEYFAEFAVQAVGARRADRGRLLRDDAGPDRGRPRGVRRRPRRPHDDRGRRAGARARRPPRRERADRTRARASARASGSSRSSSTRRRAARSTASSRSRARSEPRGTPASSTSTTTRWRARG